MAAGVISKANVKRIGIESDHLTLSQHAALCGKITAAQLIPTSGLVERLREVKDPWELAQIREAIHIAQRGIAVVRSSLRPGQTETEVRYLLEAAMRDFGANGTAFEPIVGVGPTAALPHAHAGSRRISESPILLIDWGAQTASHRFRKTSDAGTAKEHRSDRSQGSESVLFERSWGLRLQVG